MNFYSVVLIGSGLNIFSDDSKSATGFFTTRIIKGGSEVSAREKALRVVRDDWKAAGDSGLDKGEKLILEIDSVRKISLFDYLSHKTAPQGYTFFQMGKLFNG